MAWLLFNGPRRPSGPLVAHEQQLELIDVNNVSISRFILAAARLDGASIYLSAILFVGSPLFASWWQVCQCVCVRARVCACVCAQCALVQCSNGSLPDPKQQQQKQKQQPINFTAASLCQRFCIFTFTTSHFPAFSIHLRLMENSS